MPINLSVDNEILGRLYLWAQSIEKSQELFKIASKVSLKKQTDFEENLNSSNQFTSWTDYSSIQDACRELAIVYFCHMFNRGDEKAGEASKNDKEFRNAHLEKLKIKIFNSQKDLDDFETFKVSVMFLRDKILAHTDALPYSISHGNPISVLKQPKENILDIDYDYFDKILGSLRREIYNEINILKIKNR